MQIVIDTNQAADVIDSLYRCHVVVRFCTQTVVVVLLLPIVSRCFDECFLSVTNNFERKKQHSRLLCVKMLA